MTEYAARIPIGIGNLVYHRAQMDGVRDRYDRIEVGFRWQFLEFRTPEHKPFVLSLARVLFGEPPYVIAPTSTAKLTNNLGIWRDDGILPQKPRLAHLLCKGTPLTRERPYLLLATKMRDLERKAYERMRNDWLALLRDLSQRYDLVVIGEREVEYNYEYRVHGPNIVYSIYDDLRQLPIVDLTVPRLGLTVPSLDKLRQDCVYIRDAACCVTLGLSGLFCTITAVGKTLGWRTDHNHVFDYLYANQEYDDAFVTHECAAFFSRLEAL